MSKIKIHKIFFPKLLFFILFIIFCFHEQGACQNLIINRERSGNRDIVIFTVSIKKAQSSVRSFGFDLHFDPQIFEYRQYERAELTADYDFFDCRQIKPGVVRVGGFDKGTDNNRTGRTGKIVTIYLKKNCCNSTALNLENLVDDIKGWSSEAGLFFCLKK